MKNRENEPDIGEVQAEREPTWRELLHERNQITPPPPVQEVKRSRTELAKRVLQHYLDRLRGR